MSKVAEDDPNEGLTAEMVHITPVPQRFLLECLPLPPMWLSDGCGQLLRFLECDCAEQRAIVSCLRDLEHLDNLLLPPNVVTGSLHYGGYLYCSAHPRSSLSLISVALAKLSTLDLVLFDKYRDEGQCNTVKVGLSNVFVAVRAYTEICLLEIRLVAPGLLSIRTCVHGYCSGLR
ncbi:hypothetical protein T12_15319 [Trichinella patagoniensis]|uniref:Uncharacterized protein n=1 Tax=Trichinella patagoniensis TaxID=990121 RepID=A0A0V0Z9B0_9BILA|nr:hypothetical protein T12_15319 [Trichinella patagoniensis]